MLTTKLVLKSKTNGAALLTAAFVVLFSTASFAYNGPEAGMAASDKAPELQGIGIDEHLGKKIDLNTSFKDENGQTVTLGSYFDGKHPVIISPVYFACPGLCNFHLNGLTDALKLMDKEWTVGKKYKILSVSFDSKETPDLALHKKDTYMKLYGREGAEKSWHFLTGNEASVQAITKELGFKFRWDEQSKEWAHASAAVVISPDGTISRYLPGIMFQPQDIKIALNEAAEGKIGSFVDSLVLYCFKYDPHQSKFVLAAVQVMKLGGALMVLLMVLWLLPVYIRSRRAKNNSAGR
ncbi:SCO family protein [Bdellovibrio sp. NC01]|uniref:SCO family protein n=1 Tax=Bdellovibrio sp. NC01 TaxID=2220073 RepID=UPI00115707C3|nr:SCO family protein [Bdellovibrio sp. NC01]QDK36326.1 SCO family protein [Bdellovibrio sp. NC01]